MSDGLCDVPSGNHEGAVRPYPCGSRCTAHAPQARPVDAAVKPAAAPMSPRTVPTAACSRQVLGALRIDCGEGFAVKDADPGEFSWRTPPRARFECVACGWRSETVTGAIAVQSFINHIRATHTAICPGADNYKGAHAA